MNIEEVRNAIKRVIRRHRDAFIQIDASQPKLLELGAVTGMAEHYKSHGYAVRVVNPKRKKSFIVKTSTRGFPWNFSRIVAERNGVRIEVHMNLMVRSAHDDGIYCVDVGIVSDAVPIEQPAHQWLCVENLSLITFAEVKKLVIYPMLLAQFIGIVHEIKPEFLLSRTTLDKSHLSPVLIALQHFSGNAGCIVQSYINRGIHVTIAENYDIRLARVRSGAISSPFEEIGDELQSSVSESSIMPVISAEATVI
jgi:hypothetical protein